MDSKTKTRSLLAEVECEVIEEGREWMRRRIEHKLQKRVAAQGRISPLKRPAPMERSPDANKGHDERRRDRDRGGGGPGSGDGPLGQRGA